MWRRVAARLPAVGGRGHRNDNLDITSAEQLGKLAGGLNARNVPFGLAHVHGPALEMAERSGLGRPAGPG